MDPVVPKKLKAQCQTCKKSFGGTVEKLKATAKCPKCGAEGDWWRPVETRVIQRSRVQAQRNLQPYAPPPLPGGHQWVPREVAVAKNRELVLGLGIFGIVLSPLGLITGPLGLALSIAGFKQVKRREVPSDGMLTGGAVLCGIGFLFSLVGAFYCYYAVDYLMQMDEIDRATIEVDKVADAVIYYANKHQEFPNSLEQVRKTGTVFPQTDPWGNPYVIETHTNGGTVICYGADGKRGGDLADADIESELVWGNRSYSDLFSDRFDFK